MAGNLANGYMPTKQADQVDWANNLAMKVKASAETYGVTEVIATSFGDVNDALQAAWALSQDPATATKVTRAAKDDALLAMRVAARQIVGIIQATPSVTNAMKEDLRLTIRDVDPTPVGVPTTAPVGKLRGVYGRNTMVQFNNAEGDRRARPKGVTGAYIYTHVGPIAPADLADWMFRGGSSKTTVELKFDTDLPPGETVWVTACWYNGKAQAGPASQPLSVTFGAAGVGMPKAA